MTRATSTSSTRRSATPLGQIDDKELAKRLSEQPSSDSSPKSVASAHRALARSLREKGRFDAAKDELKKALEQDPDNPEIMFDIADLALSMKDFDSADAEVQKVLAKQSDNRAGEATQGNRPLPPWQAG
jgi:Tfp pilus assembly protein PilF